MKYILSSIFAFIIIIFISAIPVYSDDLTTYFVNSVYNPDDQETITFISNYSSIGYPQNVVPNNEIWTNYHLSFSFSPITGATSTNPVYIRLYFNSDGDYNFTLSRNNNGLVSITCDSQFRYQVLDYYRGSWRILSSSYFNYMYSWQIQSSFYLPASSSNLSLDLYVVYNTLNSYTFTGQVNEPNNYVDNFFAYKNGNGIEFGVEPTFNSQFIHSYYTTQEYTLSLEIYQNGSFSNISFDSYAYYLIQKNINIIQSEGVEDRTLYQDYPVLRYWSKMRGVMVNKYEYPPNNPPNVDFNPNHWVKWKSTNGITLNQILSFIQNTNQNATVSDVLTQYRLRFYLGNKKVKEFIIDFTPIQGESIPSELPPDSDDTPNPYDPWADLNDNLSSNKYYLQSIAYGDTYMSNGMSQLLLQINEDELNPFDMPEYVLTDPDFDDDTMTWFRRVVTWWYSTPFGFIAVVALTFLIIRTIVW